MSRSYYRSRPRGITWPTVALLLIIAVASTLLAPYILSNIKLSGFGLPQTAPTAQARPVQPARVDTGRAAGNQDLRPAVQQTADTNAARASIEQNMLDVAAQPTPAPADQAPLVAQPAAPMSTLDQRSPAQATADTEAAQASEEQNTLNAANQIHAIEQQTAQALAVQSRAEAEAKADAQAAAAQASLAATATAEYEASQASEEQNMLNVLNQPTPQP